MQIIDLEDLRSYVRQPDADAELYVDLANGIVSDLLGDLASIPTRVRAITLEVAARAFRNPNGYSSETVDDYTYRRDADTRQAGVYLTPAEEVELVGFTGQVTNGVYSVPLGGADLWP